MTRNLLLACAASAVFASPTMAQDANSSDTFTGEVKDAWISGKVEMAYTLNEHLNPFDIDTSVESGVVMLKGNVDSDIERDLAAEIARGVDGVVEVQNALETGMPDHDQASAAASEERRNFPTWFDDATTTAAVKSKLIANPNTKGLQIDVDTHEDVVTLSGSVTSDEQKQLAAELARNTGDVKNVRNLLVVKTS